MKKTLEICCYSAESAIKAALAGADRIELCDNFSEGGTTPSYATVQYTRKHISIPLNIIIRPRGGDFLYSESEFEIMKQDALHLKKLGINGIVFGILTTEGKIDIKRTTEIVQLVSPLECTFHRAFDMCENQYLALEQLKNIGINRVLTSGGQNTAFQGIETLARLVEIAKNDISVMPGSGINENNIQEILDRTNASDYHTSAKEFLTSCMNYSNPNISMGKTKIIDEYKTISVNSRQIINMKRIIKP